MTEDEWLTDADPDGMIDHLGRYISRRKVRLFASACCRHSPNFRQNQTVIESVEVAERYADGTATREERRDSRTRLILLWNEIHNTGATQSPYGVCVRTACQLTRGGDPVRIIGEVMSIAPLGGVSREVQAGLLRDIFGNPFRPVTLDPEWRTSTAVALAAQMYESRDFSAMPILADALQDAGCENADILEHCRGPGPHVRGCWVVDLVLGKE